MIYHGNRVKMKDGVSPEEARAALEMMQRSASEIPVVKSCVVGQDIGVDWDFGAVFVLEDLDAYWEYLTHPAHAAVERAGLPLMAKFESFDITDDLDPGFQAKVAELQRRHYETDPEVTAMVASLPVNLGSSALSGTDQA
ncbi:Dabb family protein [Amycolatopsis rubida]|uniref:Dabb family protein n=1 Tax=Amycolatopsis rubida TaxID=112413 RepID=A0ABX0BJS2_9PSEU|nr:MULTISPECIES: Dabb family protein [Amycolatopsis]MYW90779.1 Dabb family protein [Amycolatopsis rubida]NEC55762.1 Dabb family protein [Amycolatopsis rubida]OAP26166.1 Stress responsive A/B Barrel Domain protein [Amycolatopsis sp. M39]